MNAAELLLDLGRLGIHLEADAERLRYYPRSAMTPDLAARLKAHKGELLAMLRPPVNLLAAPAPAMHDATAEPTKAICRCGSATWQDVAIHGGRSIRRDCGRCGRFVCFPVWYGNDALRNEQ